MREAGEKYRKGIVSLAEALPLAKVSICEMMEHVDREKNPSSATNKRGNGYRSKELGELAQRNE